MSRAERESFDVDAAARHARQAAGGSWRAYLAILDRALDMTLSVGDADGGEA